MEHQPSEPTLAGVARRPIVPPPLTHAPFTLEDAHRQGLNRRHLISSAWKRIGPGVYAHRSLADSEAMRVEAAAARLSEGAAFSGLASLWLHDLDVPLVEPLEATVNGASGTRSRSGILLRRAELPDEDVEYRHGHRVTTIERTLLDSALRLPLVEAVVVADLALHARLVTIESLAGWVGARRRRPGVVRLRRVLELAEPKAESPMETRLRLLLVLAGLPTPLAQIDLHDATGRFLGRADLYYPARRLALEYDGGIHRNTLIEDNRRQNRLLAAGYRLLRFTAPDILTSPAATVAQVRAALS